MYFWQIHGASTSAAFAIGASVVQAFALPVMPNTVGEDTISTMILMMSLSTRFW